MFFTFNVSNVSIGVNNAEYFFEKYRNIIIGALGVLAILIGGWWAYNNLVKGPKETKAKDAIIYAQKYFEMDSTFEFNKDIESNIKQLKKKFYMVY